MKSALLGIAIIASHGLSQVDSVALASGNVALVKSTHSESNADLNRVDAGFIRALTLLEEGRKPQGYALLEQVFSKSSSDAERAKASMLLSFANNADLRIKKRHQYAEFCLAHPMAGLTAKEKAALLRIAGDGYFEQAELSKAEFFFNELARTGDPSDFEYSEYKNGWIDLNRNGARLAFNRWSDLLQQGKTLGLRESVIHDLGRSWAETLPPDSRQTQVVQALNLNPTEEKRFLDGISAGMRRMKNTKEVSDFRKALFQTRFAVPIFTRVLSQEIGTALADFKSGSTVPKNCSILDWMEGPIPAKEIDPKLAVPLLNLCFKSIEEEQGILTASASAEGRQKVERLSKAYGALILSGLNRWPRAEFFKETGDLASSCLEFMLMAEENFAVAHAVLPDEAMRSFALACKDEAFGRIGASGNSAPEESSQRLLAILKDYASAGMLPADSQSSIYKLIADRIDSGKKTTDFFYSRLMKLVLQEPETFRKTFLPVVLANSSITRSGGVPKTEVNEQSDALLKAYAPVPIVEEKFSQVWVELLRLKLNRLLEARQFSEARTMLAEYLPLGPSVFKINQAAELWTLWALALPENQTDVEGKKTTGKDEISNTAGQVVDLLFEHLEGCSSEQRCASAFALALRLGKLQPLWANGSLRAAMLSSQNSDVVSRYYQKTFDLVSSGKIDSRLVSADDKGRMIVAAANIASKFKSIAPTALREDVREFDRVSLGVPGKDAPAFLVDLKKIIKLDKESSMPAQSRLAFNSRLPKNIETRMVRLNGQIKNLNVWTWSDSAWSEVARLTLVQNCDSFIEQLQGIKPPKEIDASTVNVLEAQVHSVVGMVKSWKEAMLSSMPNKEKI